MVKTKVNFRQKLFISITMLLTIIIIICSFIYYFTYSENLKNNEYESNRIISERIKTQIDQLYNQMEVAATSLINIPDLKKSITLLNSEESNQSIFEKITQKQSIENNLGTIMFFPNISNVLLYNSEKKYFYYSGYYLNNKNLINNALSQNEYYKRFLSPNSKILIPPHINPWQENDNLVISVCKNFFDSSITKNTIIEVQVPYKVLDNICVQNSFESNKSIIIFNENYDIIYPFNLNLNSIESNSIDTIKSKLKLGINEGTTNSYSYSSAHSDYTGFNVILITNNSYLMKQKLQFIFSTILFAVLILVSTLGLLFFIIKKLSSPLNQLIKHINTIEIDNDTKLSIEENSFDEFKIINDSFNEMVQKLKESLTLTYESEIREANANLFALQAQINPHFLYNTLNAISAASEIYGSEVTTKMCQDLSFMMRYVTLNKQNVTLIEEINHTKNYLELMKISNDGNFDYTLDIPLEAYDIQLPKLTIQPIVENCFKHAFKESSPPWHINITCIQTNSYYKIIIKDNGTGFDNQTLTDINNFFEEYKLNTSSKIYKDLTIGGLGLKNIFCRLIIFDKNISFKINTLSEGCEIIIERGYELD